MITLTCKKFDWRVGSYQPHRQETISAETARKIIESMAGKPVVEGFYQYRFVSDGQVFVVYTLCADLKGFIESSKTEKK